MTSEDWKSAWDLYQAVCDLPAQDQRACLESSGLRPEILAEVRVLLENSEKPSAGAASPTPGASFGRYVIVGRIGSGGMGDVYLARDTELDRSIALKFLNPERSGSLSAGDRFIREAKAASALNHPNIVTIHEVIRSESALAIAMERIEGKALRDFQGTPLPLEQVVRLGRQVADALAAAHDQGIVHRDIKPENVMVRPDGLVKVLDFGLARRLRTNDRTSTAGLAAGTLRYMSPEQARGEELSGATDIFSLGIMLYELAVGQYPFESGSPFGTVQAIVVSDPLRPSQVRRTIPKGFDALVLSMLAKSPGERPSAREVVRALDQIQLASAPPRRLGWRLYAGLALAIIVLGGGFLFVRERNQEAPVWRALPFTSQTGQQVAPSFSPDGRTVAFVLGSASGNRFSICTKPLSGGQQSCLTPPDESEFSPAWSPDGNWIGYLSGAFGSKNTVWIRSQRTGEKRKISDIASGNWPVRRALAWTPDGKALLLTASSALYELTLDGGKRRQLTQPPEDAADYFPAVSRDGRQLLFTRFDRGVATVYVTPLDQPGPLTAIVPPDLSSAVWAAGCWRPNQREIILVASTAGVSEIWVYPLNGKPALLARISSSVHGMDVSRDGKRMIYSQDRSDMNLWRLDLTRSRSQPELCDQISSTRDDRNPQYSPDGTKVAFESDRSGYPEIWVGTVTGSDLTQLTHFNGPVTGSPHWSPDGQWIVLDSRVNRIGTIFVVPSAGGAPKAITSGVGSSVVPSWSHDGRWIYFGSTRSGRMQVWRMRPDGTEAEQMTRDGGFAAQESADGRFLFYTKSPSRDLKLWRLSLEGGDDTVVLPHVQDRAFAVTPKGIYFGSLTEGSRTEIGFLPPDQSEPVSLALLSNRIEFGLAVRPDIRELMFAQADARHSELMIVDPMPR